MKDKTIATGISRQNEALSALMHKKDEVINEVEAIMSDKARNRASLSQAQMKDFTRFTRVCENNTRELSLVMAQIHEAISPKALHITSGEFHKKLSYVRERQKKATAMLREMVEVGEGVIPELARR
ncbi:MAG: hypothetical protein LBU36_01075 [Clostridiales bacterium]|jgi:hypothetical protein|nr:hypothetical protein [Clostridiales bacterium]